MKTTCILGALLACVMTLAAEAPPTEWAVLKVANNKEYTEAKLLAVEDDCIKVQHASGVARIPYEHLPSDLRQQFAFDPEKAKVARAKRLTVERQMEARQANIAASKARSMRSETNFAKVKWEIVNVKIVSVHPEGLICFRYQPGGAAGETARTVNALVDRPNGFRVPAQQTTVDAGPRGPLWFLQGVKEKCAEGDVLVGVAGRYGEREWEGRTLPRWIAKPD